MRKWILCLILVLFFSAAQACRLWNFLATENTTIQENQVPVFDQMQQMYSLSPTYEEGWGAIAFTQHDTAFVHRSHQNITHPQSTALWISTQMELLNHPSANAVAWHLRQASSGLDSIPDPHPFLWKRADNHYYAFAHHGSISKEIIVENEDFVDWVNDPLHPERIPTTYGNEGNWWESPILDSVLVDSELYFLFLIQHIEEHDGDILNGINAALPKILPGNQGRRNLNFTFTDGTILLAYRNSRDDAHRLFFQSDTSNYHYHAVMTEPGNGTWQEIPNRSLFYAPQQGPADVLATFPSDNPVEIHVLHAGENWISFPRLPRETLQAPHIADIVFPQLDSVLQEVQYSNGHELFRFFNPDSQWICEWPDSLLYSEQGYKIVVSEPCLLPVWGECIDENTMITLSPNRPLGNWIGYFRTDSPTLQNAFGSAWQYVNYIESEDWLMYRENGIWYLPADVPFPLRLHYGKSYVVKVDQLCYLTWGVDPVTASTVQPQFPQSSRLHANVPNPFNPETTLHYTLIGPIQQPQISIYNIKGQKIRTLPLLWQTGHHSVRWDGRNSRGEEVASGVYLYQLINNDQIQMTRKMTLLK